MASAHGIRELQIRIDGLRVQGLDASVVSNFVINDISIFGKALWWQLKPYGFARINETPDATVGTLVLNFIKIFSS